MSAGYAQQAEATKAARPLRVLLVEDSQAARRMVRAAVDRTGVAIDLDEAVDLASASAAVRRQHFDCALVDYRLPDGDGLALIGELRALGRSDTAIVMLTAVNDEQVAVHALQAGAQDYLIKQKLDGHALLRSIRYAIERKRATELQLHLLHVDRMVSLGTLAAGVAHEINNPLAYMIANLTLMGERLDAASAAEPGTSGLGAAELREFEELVREVRIGADRVRSVVRDMRAFSRPDEKGHRPVKLDAVLDQSISMAWNHIRHRARLVKRYEPVPCVQADESRLGQVFLNLLINAAQAIPEGNAPKHEIRVTIRPAPAGVEVAIEDTGQGIPPESLNRIFDPFYTTKPVGSGTGLGLFICDGIIRGMGGEIAVESVVGQQTAVRVLLPATEEEPRPDAPAAPTRKGCRGKKVLVVDDEPIVLTSIRRLLEPEHSVVTSTRAAEALRRIGKGERFDVILCDLMMPEMSGMQFHAEILRSAPDLAERMLFITGGAFSPMARQFLERVPNLRIEKPFDVHDLRDLVARMGT